MSFGIFKNPVRVYGCVLLPGIGYRAASVCPQPFTAIVSCSRELCFLPAADSLILDRV